MIKIKYFRFTPTLALVICAAISIGIAVAGYFMGLWMQSETPIDFPSQASLLKVALWTLLQAISSAGYTTAFFFKYVFSIVVAVIGVCWSVWLWNKQRTAVKNTIRSHIKYQTRKLYSKVRKNGNLYSFGSSELAAFLESLDLARYLHFSSTDAEHWVTEGFLSLKNPPTSVEEIERMELVFRYVRGLDLFDSMPVYPELQVFDREVQTH